jgi:hypothetical protein
MTYAIPGLHLVVADGNGNEIRSVRDRLEPSRNPNLIEGLCKTSRIATLSPYRERHAKKEKRRGENRDDDVQSNPFQVKTPLYPEILRSSLCPRFAGAIGTRRKKSGLPLEDVQQLVSIHATESARTIVARSSRV